MAQYWLSDPWSRDLRGFDPFRRALDELFDRAGTRAAPRANAFPPVNIYEVVDGYVVTAELPGLNGDDIDVAIEANRVTLRGERKIEHPVDASLHRVERQAGIFRRTIELANEVDADKAEATYRNGVLVLRIPKAEKHQPRRIDVKAGSTRRAGEEHDDHE